MNDTALIRWTSRMKYSLSHFFPSSHMIVATIPSSRIRLNSWRAATMFAHELGPTKSPWSRASRRISSTAPSLCIDTTSPIHL